MTLQNIIPSKVSFEDPELNELLVCQLLATFKDNK